MFLLLFFLAIGPRQFYDEDIPGLRYEDEPNTWHQDKQFLNDETPDYPSEELYDPPLPEAIRCEENDVT